MFIGQLKLSKFMKKVSFLLMNIIFLIGSSYFIKNKFSPFNLLDSISKNHPVYKNFLEFQRKYGHENKLFIGLSFEKRFVDEPKYLQFIHNLTKDINRNFPELKAKSITNQGFFTLIKNKFKTHFYFDEKKNVLEIPSSVKLSPFFKNSFWNGSEKVTWITLDLNKVRPKELKRLITFLKEFKKPKNTDYHLFGHSYFQHVVREESIKGQLTAIPLFTLITFLFFKIYFSSYKVSLISLYIIFLSYLITLIFIIYWEGTLSPFGGLALLISFMMSLSDLIHYFYFLQKNGKHQVLRPCFFTSITTTIGLFSLCLSDIKPVFNFGLYGGFAVMVSFFATFYILPILNKTFNIALPLQGNKLPKKNRLSHFGEKIFEAVTNYKRIFVTTFFLIIALSFFFIQKVTFKENFLKQLKEGHAFSKSASFFKNNFNFAGQVDLILVQKREFFLKAEIDEWEVSLKEKLLRYPLISKVQGLTTLKEDLKKRSQLTLDHLKILDQLSLLERFLPSSSDESRIILNIKSQDSDDLYKLFRFIESSLKNPYFEIKIDGYSKVRYTIMKFLFSTFYGSFFLSFIGIFLAFLVLFKSFKLALMGMIPNILPVLIVSGLQGALNIGINFYLVILNCLILGISVDDTIHFLYHFTQEKKDLKKVLSSITPPLFLTTFVLCLLFPLLSLSAFVSFGQVALFLCVAFIVALLSDLIFLPSIILSLVKRKSSL